MTQHKLDAKASPRTHRTDLVSLVFGLLFLAVAGWWAASFYLDWVLGWNLDMPDVGWLLAGALILLGLLGVLASLRRGRPEVASDAPGRDDVTEPPAADDANDEPVTAPTTFRPDAVRAAQEESTLADPGAHRPETPA